MKKLVSCILALFLLAMLVIPAAAAEDCEAAIGGLENDIWFSKYGNVYTNCSAADFTGSLGYTWGDLVRVQILDQELLLPVVPDYSYVDSGATAIIVRRDESGQPDDYVSMAINMGNFAEVYGLATKITDDEGNWHWEAQEGITFPLTIRFSMAEPGSYRAQVLLHDLTRTNAREDYPHLSDPEFANFRELLPGKLYRTSSPINPELGRNAYADSAVERAGVTVIMNLADSPEEANSYPGFTDSYYSRQQVIFLNLGVDFAAADFQTGLAKGLRFFAEHPGTYAVHCTEGKDRAGFVSALLNCLAGRSYEEVVSDYMVTYHNYYGVEPGTEKYDAIANSNIIKTLKTAYGVEELENADLNQEAEEYILQIGLTKQELSQLKSNLGIREPVSNALIVVLTGAVLVCGVLLIRKRRHAK